MTNFMSIYIQTDVYDMKNHEVTNDCKNSTTKWGLVSVDSDNALDCQLMGPVVDHRRQPGCTGT